MEVSSGVSENGASGKVGMGSGPLVMGADMVGVSVASAAVRPSALRRWLWARILLVMEVVLVSALSRSILSGLGT